MSAQRYRDPAALAWLSRGRCPECGEPADEHDPDKRFWVPRSCDLTPAGVADRVAQYVADHEPPAEPADAGCPWCGESAEDMKAAAGVASYDAALEAHVEDCAAYQAEQPPSTSM